MKTTFKQYLLEAEVEMHKARSVKGLLDSVKDGYFTLDGSQLVVSVNFYCDDKDLRSLKGCPETVEGSFECVSNKLESLEGAPRSVGGNFYCWKNKLRSLKGCPNIHNGHFDCSENELESLEGAPKIVSGNFYCSDNHLTSLESIHMHVHEIGGLANFRLNPINSHVLGLLKIKGLKTVFLTNDKVANIINKYLLGATSRAPSIRDIVDCQEELMDNDLEDYALL